MKNIFNLKQLLLIKTKLKWVQFLYEWVCQWPEELFPSSEEET